MTNGPCFARPEGGSTAKRARESEILPESGRKLPQIGEFYSLPWFVLGHSGTFERFQRHVQILKISESETVFL